MAFIKRGLIAVSTLFLALTTGCTDPELTALCPAYIHYSRADDLALLAELRAHPDMPVTQRYLRDGGKLRKSVAVICGER